jgi:hypothetical protein
LESGAFVSKQVANKQIKIIIYACLDSKVALKRSADGHRRGRNRFFAAENREFAIDL